MVAPENLLVYGDNLDVLTRYVKDESVDLVYLDPPFNSNGSFNMIFTEHGAGSAAQANAFEDTWRWDVAAARDYERIVEQGGPVADALRAFRTLVGTSDMLAYLSMMAPRLVELRRVMKPTASIYFHCDSTASHYLKLLMDAIFGAKQFRNDIVWHYSGWNKKLSNHFERRSDDVLFYGKGAQQKFNSYARPWATVDEYVRVRKQKLRTASDGRQYVLSDAGNGHRVERFLDDAMKAGVYVDDVWAIDKLNNSSREKLGYQTQKPEALLERIVMSSCDEGDVVLDPFCGCGTTVAVAQRLGRLWIGIDITHIAIGLIKHRLATTYGPNITDTYKVIGEPTDIAGAQELARTDPFQFQAWVLGLVGARVAGSDKRGGDKGIDGRLFFHDEESGISKQIIFSVKAGHLSPAYVRDLRGVVDRERAQLGVLLSFETPTAGMRTEAASSGFYDSPWGSRHQRLQLLTVPQLFDGRRVDYPNTIGSNVTYKPAPRVKVAEPERLILPGLTDPPVAPAA